MSSTIPLLKVGTASWTPLAPYGFQSILYRSEDRTLIAGAFRESGTYRMVMSFDEFVYVVAGTAQISIEGGGRLAVGPGDAFYIRQGMDLTWEMSDDFQEVAVLISDKPIDL